MGGEGTKDFTRFIGSAKQAVAKKGQTQSWQAALKDPYYDKS